MQTRLIFGYFQVELQLPIMVRDYEFGWDFDHSIVRVCIQGKPDLGGSQYASLLRSIALEYGPLLLEVDEIEQSVDSVARVLQTEVIDMGLQHVSDAEAASLQILQTGRAISFYDVSYAFVAENMLVESALKNLDAVEWWGSYWSGRRPYSHLATAYRLELDRAEPAFLQSIGDSSPVFFLAPNHGHLELMALPEQSERLVEILKRELGAK